MNPWWWSCKIETCRIIFNKSVLSDFNVTWKQVHKLVQVKLCDTKCTVKQWNSLFWVSLQLLSETLLILKGNERDMIINVYRSSCDLLVFHVRNWLNLAFLDTFSKITHISNFMKICLAGAKFFHADERTDRHYEANSLFSQFCQRA